MFLVTQIAAIAALLAASWTDVRTREVPDWLNYSLIAVGLAAGFSASLIYGTWTYAAFSLAGLALFVGIAYLMFYAGQWGGGDSKLIMGMGAIIGFDFSLSYPFVSASNLLVAFWLNTLLAGVVYAILWSLFLSVKNFRAIRDGFGREMSKLKMSRSVVLSMTAALSVISLLGHNKGLSMAVFLLAAITFLSFYLLVLVRAVEKTCMFRLRLPSQLTEGDWIAHEVKVEGKYVCGPKDLGISKKQIQKLKSLAAKGKVSRILIKEGIPFVPSFLAGFILTMLFGNVLFLMF